MIRRFSKWIFGVKRFFIRTRIQRHSEMIYWTCEQRKEIKGLVCKNPSCNRKYLVKELPGLIEMAKEYIREVLDPSDFEDEEDRELFVEEKYKADSIKRKPRWYYCDVTRFSVSGTIKGKKLTNSKIISPIFLCEKCLTRNSVEESYLLFKVFRGIVSQIQMDYIRSKKSSNKKFESESDLEKEMNHMIKRKWLFDVEKGSNDLYPEKLQRIKEAFPSYPLDSLFKKNGQ